MFRVVKRVRFDDELDAIVAAVSGLSVPKVEFASGDLRLAAQLSGPQLSELEDKLMNNPALQGSTLAVDVLEELARCSDFRIVDTTHEVVFASNRSRKQYSLLSEAFVPLMEAYDNSRREAIIFTSNLRKLTA